jgi:hypothetical protein
MKDNELIMSRTSLSARKKEEFLFDFLNAADKQKN